MNESEDNKQLEAISAELRRIKAAVEAETPIEKSIEVLLTTMRIPGYCEKCHRVRNVKVSGSKLCMAVATNQPARGICLQCEQAEIDARKKRWDEAMAGKPNLKNIVKPNLDTPL
jgi:hypothetical protein